MSILIGWALRNRGEAEHDIYVSSSPMSWPDNMPSVWATTPLGVDRYRLEVPLNQSHYIMVVARRGNEQAPSPQQFFRAIPDQAVAGQGAYRIEHDGSLDNHFEYLDGAAVFKANIYYNPLNPGISIKDQEELKAVPVFNIHLERS